MSCFSLDIFTLRYVIFQCGINNNNDFPLTDCSGINNAVWNFEVTMEDFSLKHISMSVNSDDTLSSNSTPKITWVFCFPCYWLKSSNRYVVNHYPSGQCSVQPSILFPYIRDHYFRYQMLLNDISRVWLQRTINHHAASC